MTDTEAAGMRRQFDPGRTMAMGLIIAFGSFLLFVFTCDFPPLESETFVELFCVVASNILTWPVMVLALLLPATATWEAAGGVLAVPAFILSGLFWAALLELLIVRRAHTP
jgi:hypothetical protein